MMCLKRQIKIAKQIQRQQILFLVRQMDCKIDRIVFGSVIFHIK